MQTMKCQHHQMQKLISKYMKMRENISNAKHQIKADWGLPTSSRRKNKTTKNVSEAKKTLWFQKSVLWAIIGRTAPNDNKSKRLRAYWRGK